MFDQTQTKTLHEAQDRAVGVRKETIRLWSNVCNAQVYLSRAYVGQNPEFLDRHLPQRITAQISVKPAKNQYIGGYTSELNKHPCNVSLYA